MSDRLHSAASKVIETLDQCADLALVDKSATDLTNDMFWLAQAQGCSASAVLLRSVKVLRTLLHRGAKDRIPRAIEDTRAIVNSLYFAGQAEVSPEVVPEPESDAGDETENEKGDESDGD